MDSLTHVYFADKLLSITGGDRSASVCSLFPQIDRQPAYFHRMYGHPFFNIPTIVNAAVAIYRDGEEGVADPDAVTYPEARFLEERSRMQSFAQTHAEQIGAELESFEPGVESVILAWASHTYQDIFNNPMQAFLPHGVFPCGKWSLWGQLDDAISFRGALYEETTIAELREEFFGLPLWEVELTAPALIRAMVELTAAASAVPLPEALVEDACRVIQVGEPAEPEELDRAREFLAEHEAALERMILKHGRPRVGLSLSSTAFPVGS